MNKESCQLPQVWLKNKIHNQMTNYRPSPGHDFSNGSIVSSTPKKYIQMCQLSDPSFPWSWKKETIPFFFKTISFAIAFYHQSPTTNFPTYFSSRSPYKQTGIKHTISQNLKEEKTEETKLCHGVYVSSSSAEDNENPFLLFLSFGNCAEEEDAKSSSKLIKLQRGSPPKGPASCSRGSPAGWPARGGRTPSGTCGSRVAWWPAGGAPALRRGTQRRDRPWKVSSSSRGGGLFLLMAPPAWSSKVWEEAWVQWAAESAALAGCSVVWRLRSHLVREIACPTCVRNWLLAHRNIDIQFLSFCYSISKQEDVYEENTLMMDGKMPNLSKGIQASSRKKGIAKKSLNPPLENGDVWLVFLFR